MMDNTSNPPGAMNVHADQSHSCATRIEDDVFMWRGVTGQEWRAEFLLEKPKPQIILLPRVGKMVELDESQAKSLVASAKTFIDLFQLDTEERGMVTTTSSRVLVSIHRGTWIKDRGLMAQIVTDADSHIEVFNQIASNIPNLEKELKKYQRFPSWRACEGVTLGEGGLSECYKQAVRHFPFKHYHDTEKTSISKCQQLYKCNSSSDLSAAGQDVASDFGESVRPVYHNWLPRIGFALTDLYRRQMTGQDIATLLLAMDTYAVVLDLSKVSASRGVDWDLHGCHLCVNMSTKSDFDGFDCDKPVHGYIQMPASVFYQQCPPEKRDQWYEKFCKATDGEIYT